MLALEIDLTMKYILPRTFERTLQHCPQSYAKIGCKAVIQHIKEIKEKEFYM